MRYAYLILPYQPSIWQVVRIMTLLIMQFYPTACLAYYSA
jgi:hypothetical protein